MFKMHIERTSTIVYAFPSHASVYIRIRVDRFPLQSSFPRSALLRALPLCTGETRLPALSRPCPIVCVIRLTKVPV